MADPRWLDTRAAAQHVSMREDVFLRAVKSGKLPTPTYALGERTPRWDRDALDSRMEGARPEANVRDAFHDVATEEVARQERRKSRSASAA